MFDIINTSGLLLISQAFSRAVLGIRCYIGNWQGFKRILVTSEGMSVVIYDVDDSPLTPPVPWQIALSSFIVK
jgi:hypothetical protein